MRIFYVANHPGASRTQVWEHTPDGQVLIARVLGHHRPTTVRRAEARMFALESNHRRSAEIGETFELVGLDDIKPEEPRGE